MPRKAGSQESNSESRKITGSEKNGKISRTSLLNEQDIIFALDIGTRTVVGVVGIEEPQGFKVLAVDVAEHTSRAMVDGQIHDVEQVAQVAGIVKQRLEDELGISLTKVAIAAAGRVLRTCEVVVERELDPPAEIDRSLVSSLEMEAIQQAQQKLEEEAAAEEKNQYHCVGYSIIGYFLNGFAISTLQGHKGRKIGARVLATFLPHIVVDSLYAVMGRIGLEVISLTLEPIAAINVTIPKDLRMLNLTLVDIGAGTSDIAITREGSVVAYGMVPLAGDEITEKIAQHFLVDFNTAEKVKMALTSKKQAASFVDILGKKHTVKVNDIQELIAPAVDQLAQTLSQRIMEYNGKAPNAVFLIGGGSQIPELPSRIAAYLNLPEERVAVRRRDVIQNVKFLDKKISGPEGITPFGIAITALMQRGQDFLTVKVNDRKVRIFNSRKLTVADALVHAGFSAEHLIGRSGKSIHYEFNGEKRIVRGECGKTAEIYVNGVSASIETILRQEDVIRVTPAEKGRDAVVRIRDVAETEDPIEITLNGDPQVIGTRVFINAVPCNADSRVQQGDSITMTHIATVEDLAQANEIDLTYYEIRVGGEPVDLHYRFQQGDIVECNVRRVEEEYLEQTAATAMVEMLEPTVELEDKHQASERHAAFTGSVRVIVNGREVLMKSDKEQYIFVDVFNFIDFDISKPQGSIILRLNGKQAAFTDIVTEGDCIEVYWE